MLSAHLSKQPVTILSELSNFYLVTFVTNDFLNGITQCTFAKKLTELKNEVHSLKYF